MEGQQLHHRNVHQISESSAISSLIDDCLIQIFEFLPADELLKIEAVCEQWNRVAKQSWRNIRILYVASCHEYKNLARNCSKVVKTNFFLSILKRCNVYLIALDLNGYNMMDNIKSELFLKELPNYCSNVTNLDLLDVSNKDVKLFNDENLKLLFSKIKSLSKLKLRDLILIGYCLSYLSADNIKEFDIEDCEINYRGNFHRFLSKLKNLNRLSIHHNTGDVMSMIDALNLSKCENLESFYICTVEEFCLESLSTFLAKQKNLQSIRFNALLINKKILKSIPNENLKTLEMHIGEDQYEDNNPLFPLYRFKNLIDFEAFYLKLYNNSLYELTSCMNVNLKKLTIDFEEHSVSDKLKSNFQRLQNLEFLRIDNYENFECENYLSIESIFEDLSKCKNLKELEIWHCNFKVSDFNCVEFFPNLEKLEICVGNMQNEDIAYFIKNSLKLKKLSVEGCDDVSINLIKITRDIKKTHKTGQILEMFLQINSVINNIPDFMDWRKTYKYKYDNLILKLSYF